jgi:hypothetical protein
MRSTIRAPTDLSSSHLQPFVFLTAWVVAARIKS